MAKNPIEYNARQLQRALYCAAKQNRSRRFHALYDKLYRWDILCRAWRKVCANKGAAGPDGVTIESIKDSGVTAFLTELQTLLKTGRYRPTAVRRVYIPKPDGRRRPLGIPAIRDRVVQAAAKLILEPIFEADFLPCSYGFRPKRSAHDANEIIRQWANKGYNHVIDADVEAYFDTIDHKKLMALVSQRISDRRVLKLIRQFLNAGVLEDGNVRSAVTGTPQGGVLSPLLANIYLHFLDKVWTQRCSHLGELVRYADDFVVLCRSQSTAQEALSRLHWVMQRLGLRLHPTKTRVINLWESRSQDGFDFLGFQHRKCRSPRFSRYYLYKWPRCAAMSAIRTKVRDHTRPRQLLSLSLKEIIDRLNPVLRGWGNYFRHGSSSRHFAAIDNYVRERLCIFLSKKHGQSGRGWTRWRHLNFTSLGLHSLTGTIQWTGTAHAHN